MIKQEFEIKDCGEYKTQTIFLKLDEKDIITRDVLDGIIDEYEHNWDNGGDVCECRLIECTAYGIQEIRKWKNEYTKKEIRFSGLLGYYRNIIPIVISDGIPVGQMYFHFVRT